jgi:glutamine amidotransferase/cyclase
MERFYQVSTETDAEAALAAGIFHRGELPIAELKRYPTGKLEIRS